MPTKSQGTIRLWLPFGIASVLSVATDQFLSSFGWAIALQWLLFFVSQALLVVVIVYTTPPRRYAVALSTIVLVATQFWLVLTIYAQICWSIDGFGG